jgi:RNA polymerase sigma-70 factor (ECF subfamily)
MNDELVVQARTDRTAFGLLYDLYYPKVWRYCVRRLLNSTVAEDVVSDIFLKVATKLPEFPGRTETDFRRWLFRIATNAVHAHLRQSLKRRELSGAAVRGREATSATGERWDMLDWPVVYQAVLELSERDQAILMLRFFADLSHEEIADVVEATPGAVRSALCRTLAQLRERFDPRKAETSTSRKCLKD